mgnify:CR=1 FL=1
MLPTLFASVTQEGKKTIDKKECLRTLTLLSDRMGFSDELLHSPLFAETPDIQRLTRTAPHLPRLPLPPEPPSS